MNNGSALHCSRTVIFIFNEFNWNQSKEYLRVTLRLY